MSQSKRWRHCVCCSTQKSHSSNVIGTPRKSSALSQSSSSCSVRTNGVLSRAPKATSFPSNCWAATISASFHRSCDLIFDDSFPQMYSEGRPNRSSSAASLSQAPIAERKYPASESRRQQGVIAMDQDKTLSGFPCRKTRVLALYSVTSRDSAPMHLTATVGSHVNTSDQKPLLPRATTREAFIEGPQECHPALVSATTRTPVEEGGASVCESETPHHCPSRALLASVAAEQEAVAASPRQRPLEQLQRQLQSRLTTGDQQLLHFHDTRRAGNDQECLFTGNPNLCLVPPHVTTEQTTN